MAGKEVVLGLGSNMGDRLATLQSAVTELSDFIQIEKISSVYETPPFDMQAEINFYNLCLLGRTDLTPEQILSKCHDIEAEHGRERNPNADSYESRPLDIDIIYFNNLIIDRPELQIPHPELHKRRFVLEPLSEIAPNYFDPLRELKISELVTKLEDTSTIHKIVQRIEVNK